jgi:hypothetical protein
VNRISASLVVGAVGLDISIEDASPATQQRLMQDWAPFHGDPRSAAVRVQCDWIESPLPLIPEPGTFRSDAPLARHLSGNTWFAEWQFYRAMFQPGRCHGTFTTRLPGLEHIVRGAVAWSTFFDLGLLFHGATLVYGGQAILFAGHPGAGKSTISHEGQAERVICNEISILQKRSDGWYALASPFWGTGDQPHWRAEARLSTIAVLTHGTGRTVWQPLNGVHAIAALAPHVGVQAQAQSAAPEFLNSLRTLTSEVPTYSCAWYRPEHPLQGGPVSVAVGPTQRR